MKPINRRDFLKKTSLAGAGLALGATAMTTESYGRIMGANERMNFAVVGVRSRGKAHLSSLAACKKDARVTHFCEVDQSYSAGFSKATEKAFGQAPTLVKDFRKLMEIKDVDAFTIATPEHWHAPLAIMGHAGRQTCVPGEAL